MFGFVKRSGSNRNLKNEPSSSLEGLPSSPLATNSALGSSYSSGTPTITPRSHAGTSAVRSAAAAVEPGRFNPAAFALLMAAESGEVAEVTRMLNMRAGTVVGVDDRDEHGRTALHVAAACGHLELVRTLVEVHGADLQTMTRPSVSSSPPPIPSLSSSLSSSSSSSSPPSCPSTLPSGAPKADTPETTVAKGSLERDDDARVLGRKTPLYLALQARRFDVAHYLVTKGAPVLVVSPETSATTALHLAAMNCPLAGEEESAAAAKVFLGTCYSAPWICRLRSFFSPFASFFFTDMAGMMVMVLGSANQQDELGNTALHYAVYVECEMS